MSIRTIVLLIALYLSPTLVYAQGTIMSAAGTVNRSMGGAAVAAPIDSIGAIYWNPASISGISQSETAFSLDLLHSKQTVSSSIGSFGGSTDSDNGFLPIPNVGWVHKSAIPEVTLGLGVNALAGFKTNLPADPTNPILTPAPNGLGRVSSEASFVQIAPVISYAITDKLALAAGPTITAGQIGVEPFIFESANTNGEYSAGRSSKYHWGGGFQLGSYYVFDSDWRFGASFKSKTWMERFSFIGNDANGGFRELHADLQLPMMLSVGTSYNGFENWLIALDTRFLDYENTDGFGSRAFFDATGKLHGLDYSSVFATSLGVQRKLTEVVTLRGGYSYNQNPIKNSEAIYNIASPLIYEHMLSGGVSLNPCQSLSFNCAYSYMFENTRHGQIILPGIGVVPGSQLNNTMSAHFASFGVTNRF